MFLEWQVAWIWSSFSAQATDLLVVSDPTRAHNCQFCILFDAWKVAARPTS